MYYKRENACCEFIESLAEVIAVIARKPVCENFFYRQAGLVIKSDNAADNFIQLKAIENEMNGGLKTM